MTQILKQRSMVDKTEDLTWNILIFIIYSNLNNATI